MCKCHETDFNCDQGRSCPQRIEYAGSEPPDYFSIAIVLVLLALIASIVYSQEIAVLIYGVNLK